MPLVFGEGRLWKPKSPASLWEMRLPAASSQAKQTVITLRETRERKAKYSAATAIQPPEEIASAMACGYLPYPLLHNRRFEQLLAIVAPGFSILLGTYFAAHIINTLSNLVKQSLRQNECKHMHKTTDMWTNT